MHDLYLFLLVILWNSSINPVWLFLWGLFNLQNWQIKQGLIIEEISRK